MLLLLISVLALLVVAFFALWVGVVGRVSNEGPELSVAGRGLAVVIALVAFGGAYAIYQFPVGSSAGVTTAATPAVAISTAMSSAPPDSRGQPVEESGEAVSTELLMAPEPGPDEAMELSQVSEPQSASPAPAQAANELPSVDAEALSPSAAALESRSLDRAQPSRVPAEPAPAALPTSLPATAEEAETLLVGPTKRSRRYPLLLHVHNQLGEDQQREQLTLLIEGKTVARIGVDDANPKAAVAVPLPRPGMLHYRLEGFSVGSGKTELLGHGCIKVRDGSRYRVRRTADGRGVFLEAASKAG